MKKPPLTPTEVQQLRQEWITKKTRSGRPQLKELSERYDRSHHTIRNILRNKDYGNSIRPS